MSRVAVFAHQGGWDEILFVLAPLIVFAALLWVARRRVDRMDTETPETSSAAADGSDDADRR